MKGIFVTFEGPDGCGKTTIASLLYEELKKLNKKVLRTREPGGTEISEKIRNIILDPQNTKMDYRTEALLYAASRAQHVHEKIIPALEEGYIILCERFVLSSIAYQGYGRGLGKGVETINDFATGGLKPDLVFLFKVNSEKTLLRKLADGGDRLEREDISFHKKVQRAYEDLSKNKDFQIIDASRSIEEVFYECLEKLLELIK